MLLNRDRSVLVIVDVQERLAPAMQDSEQVLARTRILLEAAGALDVPVLVSEQYPEGLGHTVAALQPHLAQATVVAKTCFSCGGEPAFLAALERLQRSQLVVCGMETHVCVLQTALELQERGYGVHVVADAVGSRHAERRELGLARMRHAGCVIVESEMVVFEWLGAAGTDTFRKLSRLIR